MEADKKAHDNRPDDNPGHIIIEVKDILEQIGINAEACPLMLNKPATDGTEGKS